MEEFRSILERVERGENAALSRTVEGKRYTRLFVPRERLILLGGGHVALALARLADTLDFAVSVADDRSEFANRERFPMAERTICAPFESALAELDVRGSDYVCILTRGHRWDRECLYSLLRGREPHYLGMIGSKHRVRGLLDSLAAEGFDPERLSRIHAPIGLMIGAVTPEEIAVSIGAQLIEKRHEKPAASAAEGLPQTNTDLGMLRFLAGAPGKKALCLVLDTDGSTPVKAGAVMAVDALGRGYGTIGGGGGEAEAMRRAAALLGTGKSEVMELAMTVLPSAKEGMTCGGTMRVYLEDL